MTIRHLRERLVYWQELLGMPDWAISLRWGSKRDMKENDGLCSWTPEYAVASILLARNQPDAEWTLVHELLHLALEGHAPMPEEDQYSEMYERGLNRTAKALVDLEKGK